MNWLPILSYHRIVDKVPADDYSDICTPRRLFARQMHVLARAGYRTLSLEDVGALLARNEPMPARRFVITFDDGYEDVYREAVPILRMLGFTATVFIVSGFVGQMNVWDEGKGCLAPLLNWDQIKKLLQAGFSIGSHTVSHPDLSQLSRDNVWYEVSQSRKSLEQTLGAPVQTFCYPYGKWTDTTCEVVREAGYALACNDVWRPEHERYALARTDIHHCVTPWTMLLRCHETCFMLRCFIQRRLHPYVLPSSISHYVVQKWRLAQPLSRTKGTDSHRPVTARQANSRRWRRDARTQEH